MSNFTAFRFPFALILTIACVASSANARAEVDPLAPGPHAVGTAEYHFPAEVQNDVLSGVATELWARVYFPKDLARGPFPLLVFLHGNHGTCGTGVNPRLDYGSEYTQTGACPPGYVVTPNHEGYAYVGEHLASHGYIVVSVNANRGITAGFGVEGDWGLVRARGRLILKHLETWKKWNAEGGAPESLGVGADGFRGRVALEHVGLMGHSRGGEGARAALNEFFEYGSPWPARLSGVKIEGIFEIGAVDGQSDSVLDGRGVAWTQLIPTCDQDVSDFQGVNPYNRMLRSRSEPLTAQKSVVVVYGANHNFFNTEWQKSESSGCFNHAPIFSPTEIGSEPQRQIAKGFMTHFYLANVGPAKRRELNQIFNPLQPVRPELASITHIERDYAVSPAEAVQAVLDDFTAAGDETTREASPGMTLNLSETYSNSLPYLDTAWSSEGPAELSITWKAARDLTIARTLDLRLSLPSHQILAEDVGLRVSLVDESGARSNEVALSEILRHEKRFNPGPVLLFETARFPVGRFRGIDLTRVRGAHLAFDAKITQRLALASLRFTHFYASADVDGTTVTEPATEIVPAAAFAKYPRSRGGARTTPMAFTATRVLRGALVHRVDSSRMTELTLASEAPFPVRDALPVLRIGNEEHRISAVDPSGRIRFRIPSDKISRLRGQTLSAEVYYLGQPQRRWSFGKITF